MEIDLRTTVDSLLVIMHDATVDRMTYCGLCKDHIYVYLDFKNADPAAAYRAIPETSSHG